MNKNEVKKSDDTSTGLEYVDVLHYKRKTDGKKIVLDPTRDKIITSGSVWRRNRQAFVTIYCHKTKLATYHYVHTYVNGSENWELLSESELSELIEELNK